MSTVLQKAKVLRRNLEVTEVTVRQEKDRKILRFTASSETPVERWFGTEVLSHEKDSVRLARAEAGALPLLFNHNSDDPRGMVDNAEIKNRKLVVETHFFETEAGKELESMVEGGLRNVSIAYRLHVVEEDKKQNRFTATDWEPLEVSIVSVPQDHTVGIGRSFEQEFELRMIKADSATGGTVMEKTQEQLAAEAAEKQRKEAEAAKANGIRAEVGGEPKSPSALEMEVQRKKTIENLCKANNLDEKYRDMWIGRGTSVDGVADEILKVLEERGKSNPQPVTRLGISQREAQQFSLRRAVLAIVDNDWSKAGFELECSRAIAQKLGKAQDPKRFCVPFEVLERPVDAHMIERARQVLARDLSTASLGAGGYLVATENQGFIEMLRNRSVLFRMGARRLSGLVGNVTVPRQSAAATAYWLADETTEVTESQQTFVQMALTPKGVSAYTEIGRLLLIQSSPDAEGIVTDDLAQVVALAADYAGLVADGSGGQPIGIIETNGVGSVSGSDLEYPGVLEFQRDVAEANVMPIRGGYVTTPQVAAFLMARSRFANTDTPIWDGNIWDGRMAGFPAMSTNQLPTDPQDSMVFGDWQELVIGEWGVLEVEVNPYANFKAGIIGIRAIYHLDIGIRRPFAFSVSTNVDDGSSS